jgi:hypothetical protein
MVIQGSLTGTRIGAGATRGGWTGGGGLAPGDFGLVSLIVSSSSIGCGIPAWP